MKSGRAAKATAPAKSLSPKPLVMRLVHARLLDLEGRRCATVTVVTDDCLPEVIMFNGDPFLLAPEIGADTWREVRPFRAVGA